MLCLTTLSYGQLCYDAIFYLKIIYRKNNLINKIYLLLFIQRKRGNRGDTKKEYFSV